MEELFIKEYPHCYKFSSNKNYLPTFQNISMLCQQQIVTQKQDALINKRIQWHIQKQFGFISPKILKEIGGYEDSNYLLSYQQINQKTFIQKKAVVKLSNSCVQKTNLEIQNKVILYLAKKNEEIKMMIGENQFSQLYFQTVKLISNKQGIFISEFVSLKNTIYYLRVFQFIQNLGQIVQKEENIYSEDLLLEIGKKTANFMRIMGQFQYQQTFKQLQKSYTSVKQKFFETSQLSIWNLSNFQENKQNLKFIKDEQTIKIIQRVFQQYQNIKQIIQSLPKQIIQADICKSNILLYKKKKFQSQKISAKALLDFGDIMYTCGFYQLIIASARLTLIKQDPLKNIILIIKGYNEISKIEKKWIQAIFPLILARITTIYMNSQKVVSIQTDKSSQNINYLVQTRDSVKQYLIAYSKFSSQQFVVRLLEALSK